MNTRLGLAALKFRAFLQRKRSAKMADIEKEAAMKTLKDKEGCDWTIPQQLLDEGVHPEMPLIDLFPICIRTRYTAHFDPDKKTVTFEFTESHLRLVV